MHFHITIIALPRLHDFQVISIYYVVYLPIIFSSVIPLRLKYYNIYIIFMKYLP